MHATIQTKRLFESTRRAQGSQPYVAFILAGYVMLAAALLASIF